jgi:ATP-dependent Clp protease ATP-binding subunit ClpA
MKKKTKVRKTSERPTARKRTARPRAGVGKSARKAAKKASAKGKGRPNAGARRMGGGSRGPSVPAPNPEALLHLEDLLSARILGKDEAVARIAESIRVGMTHLDFRPERPNGSFLIVGPPGVGKNEFAYALASILYGDESLVISLDMRTIAGEEDVSRLTDTLMPGPQPILFEGMITGAVRRRPHVILLLRWIEHAHAAACRMIQQILEQGWIEDARGRVSFEHTIIFATSRVPEEDNGPTSEIGFTRISKSATERVREKLTRRMGEEFLESFQEVIVVPALSPEDVRKIARYKVETVLQRLEQGKRGVKVSESVYQEFITDEQCSKSGAGMINRTLENKLLNPLARYLLAHPQERCLRVDVRDGFLVIEPVAVVRGGGARGRRATAIP